MELIIIPFKEYHAARISDPEQYDSIVTKDLGDGIQLLLGVKKEGDTEKTETQSYHFDKEQWKPKDVKKWLKEHNEKPIELTMAKKEDESMKENGTIVSHKGDVVQEQVPIDRVPEKLFGNVRQQDVPELLESTIDATVSISEVQKESELEDLGETEEPSIEPEEVMESEGKEGPEESPMEEMNGEEDNELEEKPWDPIQAKSDMINWATDEEGKVSKKALMKWYLDVDAGDGQDSNSYRYQVGAIVNGEPHYCHKALDFSWDLASGNQTGVANRNIQKKIIFIKNREGIPLTEDQMDYSERHMEAYKQNANCPASEKIGKGPGSCGGKTKTEDDEEVPKDSPQGKFKLSVENAITKLANSHNKEQLRKMFDKESSADSAYELYDVEKYGMSKKEFSTIYHKYVRNAIDKIKQNELFLVDENSPGGIDIVMSDEIKMNSSPAGSKIIYEDDSVIDVPVVPMREGVFTGTDGIPTLKKFEYFGKDAHWLEGQPILKGHTAPTELVTYKHNRIGKLMNVTARPDKKDVVAVARYYKDKLTPEDMARIKSGTPYDGSIAYTTHTSMTSGDLNGTKYNAIEDGGYHFYHFAELANGIGACSTKDGCGFMMNEKGYEPKVFYNDKRRAEVTKYDDIYSIKLNSSIGGSGVLEANTEQDAIEWSKTYVKSGVIPIRMKLNYNCPASEKSGSGKGACGGSDKEQDPASKKVGGGGLAKTRTGSVYSDMHEEVKTERDKNIRNNIIEKQVQDDDYLDRIINAPDPSDLSSVLSVKKELLKLGNAALRLSKGTKIGTSENKKANDRVKKISDQIDVLDGLIEHLKKTKQNSQFSNIKGNNMTEEEFIQADDTEVVDVQKMNEAFEQKLNERDAKIAELTAQVEDLVQKQNAAEQALIDAKAQADFEAFSLKLNAKAREEAKTHYEGFKTDGWSYFDTNPGLLRAETPKMNARGQPAAEGDNGSNLQAARDMLKKNQKELFGKRSH